MPGRRERQQKMLAYLQKHDDPVRGEDLAALLGVTRQVIVHEIALLRAKGAAILSTTRGYYLPPATGPGERTVLAVRHRPDQTRDELYTLVDHGLLVENVIVEHPIYGEITGGLHLRSRADVDQFLRSVEEGEARLLSTLTQGYHLHTVAYPRPEYLEAAVADLRARAIEVFE